MEFKYLVIASLMMVALAAAGCTSPSATPSPTAVAPTVTPVITAAPTADVNASTPTPAPTSTPTPTPTATPAYNNGSPVTISDIKIAWDTTGFEGRAKETATMTVKNEQSDKIAFDVVVLYKVTTPASLVNPDGSTSNFTNTITKRENIGLMQALDERSLTFQVDHTKNVPTTISIVVQWRGGEAVVFEKTINLPDNNFGTYEY